MATTLLHTHKNTSIAELSRSAQLQTLLSEQHNACKLSFNLKLHHYSWTTTASQSEAKHTQQWSL